MIYFYFLSILFQRREVVLECVSWKETFRSVYLKQSGPASKPNSASCVQSLGAKSTIGNWASFSVSISNTVLSSPLFCRETKNNEMRKLFWLSSHMVSLSSYMLSILPYPLICSLSSHIISYALYPPISSHILTYPIYPHISSHMLSSLAMLSTSIICFFRHGSTYSGSSPGSKRRSCKLSTLSCALHWSYGGRPRCPNKPLTLAVLHELYGGSERRSSKPSTSAILCNLTWTI